MKNLLIMILFTGFGSFSFAQNNAIFRGGNGDGWERTAFQQASNNIFNGGTGDGADRTSFSQAVNNIFNGGDGDGWHRTSFSQSVNNIFNGGSGDGWDRTSFAQSVNNIFNGGNGDGWDKTSFAQAGNNIFGGGDGDGWDKTNFSQAGNNIFSGGDGDGWSTVYRPMGPLPVTLLSFTAIKNSATSSLLNWRTSQEMNSKKFEVERSADAVKFSYIGTVNASGNSAVPVDYSFIDYKPMSGMNYYRLKQIDADGRSVYTPARLVRFDGLDAGTVKYYPNPTHGIVTIEMNAADAAQTRIITISNAAGAVVNQLRIAGTSPANMQIDLSHYAKGIYFIQLKTATLNSVQRIILE